MRRRALSLWLAAAAVGQGCAEAPARSAGALAPARAAPLATPWRVLRGGFLSTGPARLLPPPAARPGSGAWVRLQAPAAIALRDQELLVADLAASVVWRADLAFDTLQPLMVPAVSAQTRLLFGPDLSAWVLDPRSRQVLRFDRQGRLLQTWRGPGPTAPLASMALLDGGHSLLLVEAGSAQWQELRSGGAVGLTVRPRHADGRRLASVAALVTVAQAAGTAAATAGADRLFVLDALTPAVHEVDREGRVRSSRPLPAGVLAVDLAADRRGRVWVLDAAGRCLWLPGADAPAQRTDLAPLGVLDPAALASDDMRLALADRAGGQVVLLRLAGTMAEWQDGAPT
jgi:hypothetical protein